MGYANLKNADLESAEMEYSSLNNVCLENANLCNVLLDRASLRHADLKNANLMYSDLEGANLSLSNLEGANLENIEYDSNTIWLGAINIHKASNIPEALAQKADFKASLILSRGYEFARSGEIVEALTAFKELEKFVRHENIHHGFWYILGRMGSLYGHANEVLFASEKAVELFPEYWKYKENLALNKALIGDFDGAIKELRDNIKIKHLPDELKTYMKGWLNSLEQGQNPFTLEVVEALKVETEKQDASL